jgi:hypothetical protein
MKLCVTILVKENFTYLVQLFRVEAAYLKQHVCAHCLRNFSCLAERSDESTGQFIWKKWQVGYQIKQRLKQILKVTVQNFLKIMKQN